MDRGLLVALLALQNQFVLPPQFLLGFQTWLANRTRPFDELLVQLSFITQSQRESLTSTLLSILEKSPGSWQSAVAENSSVGVIFADMLTLAEIDATVLEWVKEIGASIATIPQGDVDRRKVIEKDPYATIDFDNEFEPYATLSSGEEDQKKK